MVLTDAPIYRLDAMHVPTVALVATAMCRRVSWINVAESMGCFLYGIAPTWSGYGFGGLPDRVAIKAARAHL